MKNYRLEAIEKMYQYRAEREDHMLVEDETLEQIENWYIEGFPTLEPLKKVFNIEDLYDMDINFKVMVKDQFELDYPIADTTISNLDKEELELLSEDDIKFGDMLYGSDRGNEMMYE